MDMAEDPLSAMVGDLEGVGTGSEGVVGPVRGVDLSGPGMRDVGVGTDHHPGNGNVTYTYNYNYHYHYNCKHDDCHKTRNVGQ